jgi:Fur family transcriptional regulator, ferric uptake regulator
MQAQNLHDSKTREAIVDAFFSSEEHHLDMKALLERARSRSPRLAMATVYRTMKLLELAGLAEVRDFGRPHALYEVVTGGAHHDHLICEECGEIQEFVSEEIEGEQEAAARRAGFILTHHRHELYGRCAACQDRLGTAE